MSNGSVDWKQIIIVAAALGAGFGGGSVSRVDPFTGSDAANLKREIALNIREMKNELIEDIRKVDVDKPPPKTKLRIRAIEIKLQELDGYEPPTYDWK